MSLSVDLVNSVLKIKRNGGEEILKPGKIYFWVKEEWSGSGVQGY
jgi:hypothetical protein